ncbi:hypothetical protein UPYG_G00049630 [Umbra pygmaea]|uniref:Uncharacterized protein n=1 Tax=Umbra pygmaea TaxID=75934 RepID=A0ABD0XRQ1_UMBPY
MEEPRRKVEDSQTSEAPSGMSSAMEVVLSSFCPAHRSLLQRVLRFAHQQHHLSLAYRDAHRRPVPPLDPVCCHLVAKPQDNTHSPHLSHLQTDCKTNSMSGCCCVQRCQLHSVCFCLKSLHCLSCQSLALGRLSSRVCSSTSSSLCPASALFPLSSVCCSQTNPRPCAASCCSEHTCLAPPMRTTQGGVRECPVLRREGSRSPSPPPLSPIPSDMQEDKECRPPSLQPHQEVEEQSTRDSPLLLAFRDEAETTDPGCQESGEALRSQDKPRSAHVTGEEEQSGGEGGSQLLQDLVERFREKLETIRPQEKDPPLNSALVNHSPEKASHTMAESKADTHLSEIITTVLHTGCGNDYSLNEMLHRHDNNKKRSPQTRSQRRLELAAMTTSPDQPSARRKTMLIKRELARLDESMCRKKLLLGKSKKEEEIEGVKEEGLERLAEAGMQHGKESEEKGETETVYDNKGSKRVTGEEAKTVKISKEIEKNIRVKEEIEEEPPFHSDPSTQQYPQGEKLNGWDRTWQESSRRGREIERHCYNVSSETPQCSGRSRLPCQPGQSRSAGNIGEPERRPREEVERSGEEAGRSRRRTIIPPQRFASYVTEPRKMYFAACFSESIFSTQRTPKGLPPPIFTSNQTASTPSVKVIAEESALAQSQPTSSEVLSQQRKGACRPTLRGQSLNSCQVTTITAASSKQLSVTKHISQSRRDFTKSAARSHGCSRSSPVPCGLAFQSQPDTHRRVYRPGGELPTAQPTEHHFQPKNHCSEPHSQPKYPCPEPHTQPKNLHSQPKNPCPEPRSQSQYTSPIKLMFVSAVVGEEGVRYILKSVSETSWHGEGTFDPCEESSWAGTPEETNNPQELRRSPKTIPKSNINKSSLREGSSPPKRSPGSLNGEAPPTFLETTPPKRRPGRPKKLGPQLEKKAKRPIGRPPKQRDVEQSGGFRKVGPDQDGGSGCSIGEQSGVARTDCQETNPANRNLKITVLYGRSRRTKRTVSEDEAHLQVTQQQKDFNLRIKDMYLHSPEGKSHPATSKEQTEDLTFVRPVKERKIIPHTPHNSSSNFKCQKLKSASAMRRPGRPAKVRISGISVTVTTVSPRQRKIHINRTDCTRKSLETFSRRKALLPELQLSKEPKKMSGPSCEDLTHDQTEKSKDRESEPHNQTPTMLAVRHSVRVRKPSVYLLHSVATSASRSRSHSTALLRRSRQLLLNKASSEGNHRKRQEEETQGGEHNAEQKGILSGCEDIRSTGRGVLYENLNQVAELSVESIFPPNDSEVLRWWPVSSDQDNLKEELARRVSLISQSWVSSNTASPTSRTRTSQSANQRLNGSSSSWKPLEESAVRLLFDRRCSVKRLASWFMQTTETQSLGIVKKTSSRNPYELLHYPGAVSRGSICPSPQAERLRKHVKKFAKTVPRSPAQLRLAQKSLRHGNKMNAKRCLFSTGLVTGTTWQTAPWRRGWSLGTYRTILHRVKDKFLPRGARMIRANRLRYSQAVWSRRRQVAVVGSLLGQIRPSAQTRKELINPLVHHQHLPAFSSHAHLTDQQMGAIKQQRLRSKAWSPETLKECRVFLKKINSPDTESTTEEDCDVCTVKLDEAYCPDGTRQEEVENQAVKMGQRKRRSICNVLLEKSGHVEQQEAVIQEQDRSRNRIGKQSPGKEMTQSPPPAKLMRQSRGRGLTGPWWRDFVLGS